MALQVTGPQALGQGPDQVSQVINIYHCGADNIGDLMSGPAQYYWPDLTRKLPVRGLRQRMGNAIIGGGQLGSQIGPVLASIHGLNPDAKVVGWGVGLPPNGVRDGMVRDAVRGFALFGTRNYDRRDSLAFVPCASCLSPCFDKAPSPRHDLVFYLHRRKGDPIAVPADIPVMTNAARAPKEAIDFIASGETVVTSSYHGVYWAQLLGRRVICLPYNNKFETFQHRPAMADAGNWRSIPPLPRVPPLLEEYRALNQAFAQQVLEIWNG